MSICKATHLVSVSSIRISEPLNVVEDQPCQGDDHQHNEGDGDKYHRGSANVLLQVSGSNCYMHHHSNISLQQTHYLFPLWLRDHYCYNIFCTCQIGKKEKQPLKNSNNQGKQQFLRGGKAIASQQQRGAMAIEEKHLQHTPMHLCCFPSREETNLNPKRTLGREVETQSCNRVLQQLAGSLFPQQETVIE